MSSTQILIGAGALVLAWVHLFAGRMRFLDRIPRSRWLSIASGTSVAYVFLHLLPELTSVQRSLERASTGLLGLLEHHAYFVAAIGLTAFYGLERLAAIDPAGAGRGPDGTSSARVFWLHVGSFAIYNLLIGYLLTDRVSDRPEYLAFVAALGFHFVVNDHGLRQHHAERYDHAGRWLLSMAVLAGAAVGLSLPLPMAVVQAFLAFVAGGIVLNVLKEELPPERESRFWPFAAGVLAFGLFLAAT